MTIQVPNWLQAGTYSAKLDRQLIAAQFDEGVMTPLSLRVSQSAGGANMGVTVSAGRAYVKGDDEPNQGTYMVLVDADEAVTWPPAPGSDSRIDVLGLQVNDPNAGSVNTPANAAVLTVVTGAPSSSPLPPAFPKSFLPLQRVVVPAGTVSITTAMLQGGSLRVIAGQVCEVGTLKPFTGGPNPPSGYLWARGGLASRADWPELAALYELLGFPYGPGDGSTTFGVPDASNGRGLIGSGTGFAPGATGGVGSVTIGAANLPAHAHASPAHYHAGPLHNHSTPAHGHTASGWTGTDGGVDHLHGPGTLSTGNQNRNHVHALGDARYVRQEGGGNATLANNGPYGPYNLGAGPYTDINDANHAHAVSYGATGASDRGLAHAHAVGVSVPGGGNGTSGDAGNGPTGGYIGDAMTGSVGSGTALATQDPFLVIPGWIVRAA